MKIGIDASRAARTNRTGTENYSYYLIRELLRLDQANQYVLYSDEEIPKEITYFFRDGVSEKIIPAQKMWSQRALPKVAENDSLDVLFVPAHILPISYSGKMVLTIHGLEYEQFSKGMSFFEKQYIRWTTKYGAKKTEHIIVPSFETKDLLVKLYGTEDIKIKVIAHGGIASEIEKQNSHIDYSKNIIHGKDSLKDEKYFFFIGRLERRKNIKNILKAFLEFKKSGSSHKLVLTGKRTAYYDVLFDDLVKGSEYEDDIILPGFISDEDYLCYLKGALALVFPSHAEGFGMPVLDAVQYGVPVIGTEHAFFKDFLSNSELKVSDAHSYEEIAQKMMLVEMGELDFSYINEKKRGAMALDWKRTASKTLDILRTIGSSSA